jgi:uncharacterized protein YjbJ (UPF0337 family)
VVFVRFRSAGYTVWFWVPLRPHNTALPLRRITSHCGFGQHRPSFPALISLCDRGSQELTNSRSARKLLCLYWAEIGGVDVKDSTKDKVQGTAHVLKGKVKQAVGRATNDPDLEDQGTGEKVAGKVQKKVGEIEKVFEK